MISSLSSQPPFEQLPIEARMLFFVYASAALAKYQSQPPTPRELATELETVWNTNRLCLSDLSDPSRLTHLLEQHFAPSEPRTADQPAMKRKSRCRAEGLK
jgi:hypothetical protein